MPYSDLPARGSQAQRQIAQMRARAIARYLLVAVPGRPEELSQPGTDKRISVGYGCGQIRVRTQQGRTWLDWQDYRIVGHEGASRVGDDSPHVLVYRQMYRQLDPHFGPIEASAELAPGFMAVQTGRDRFIAATSARVRPIRDNPQA